MKIRNVRTGVSRALRAYRIEVGASPAEADRWTTDHLQEGVDRWTVELARHGDAFAGVEAAFADLKAWSRAGCDVPPQLVARQE